MSDHLPECNQRDTAWQKAYYSGVECVCDALRACEQRVREEMAGPLDRLVNLAESSQRIAYAAGVAAARDAVAALIDPEFHWASATTGECGMHAGRDQALAAIDALRLNTADCLCPSPNPDCQHPTCPREGK